MTKFKKLILLSTCTLIGLFATCHFSFAENGWCSNVEVISAGAKTKANVVLLLNTRNDCGDWPINTKRWFNLDNSDGFAKSMLAAAMSALAMDGNLTIISKVKNNYPTWGSLTHVTVSK